MRFFPIWWNTRTDPLIKQGVIDNYNYHIASQKCMLTTPDYIESVLDSNGDPVPWNEATRQLIRDDIAATEAKIAALG